MQNHFSSGILPLKRRHVMWGNLILSIYTSQLQQDLIHATAGTTMTLLPEFSCCHCLCGMELCSC